MNITIVQGAFLPVPPVAGGAVEKLWFDLGREFARRGLAVTHLSRDWPGHADHDASDGVLRRRVRGFDFPKSRVLAKLMDLVYSVRCYFTLKPSDIIVTNTFFLPLLLSLAPRKGVVYVSVHRYPQGQMAMYRKVDRLQCVSTAIADAVREQAPAVGRLVKVVPNYVAKRLSEQEVAAGWSARRREVLFVGRVHPEKGIDLLIEAFAKIDPARRAGWTLRIVGPHETAAGGGGADFLAGLKRMAVDLALAVDWVGPIYDRAELDAAYRRARVFVYPSVAAKGEAFPLAPLEAMAQGCPVVTSDLACFSDFIRPGLNADSFALAGSTAANLGAVLDGLLADEPRQRRHSTAGLRTVQDFMLTRVADAFIDDFHALKDRAASAAGPVADLAVEINAERDHRVEAVNAFHIHSQVSAYESPWSLGLRVKVLLWEICWSMLCSWTPKPFNGWRLFWIRRFGGTVEGVAFVHGRASIIRPWNLTLRERSCLGDGAVAYCLDRIELGAGATVAQGAYLCTGTHEFNDPHTPLKTAAISIGAQAFVGLRAIVLPGVTIGSGCIAGAGSVVSRDTDAWAIYGGNPARKIGERRRTPSTAP